MRHVERFYSPTFTFVPVNRILQVLLGGEVLGGHLPRVEVLGVLGAECEGGGGDGGGEAKPLDNLLPLLLVDHLHQTSPGHYQVEQLVQVKHLFRHDWKPVDRSSSLLHEGKELI